MAKKQTRRSISVSRSTYKNAKEHADRKGVSLSQMTEQALIVSMAKDAHPELGPLFDQIISATRDAEQAKKSGASA